MGAVTMQGGGRSGKTSSPLPSQRAPRVSCGVCGCEVPLQRGGRVPQHRIAGRALPMVLCEGGNAWVLRAVTP